MYLTEFANSLQLFFNQYCIPDGILKLTADQPFVTNIARLTKFVTA